VNALKEEFQAAQDAAVFLNKAGSIYPIIIAI